MMIRKPGIMTAKTLLSKEAEAYNVSGYPEVLKTLTSLVEGTPRVGVAELATSTLHKRAAAKTA